MTKISTLPRQLPDPPEAEERAFYRSARRHFAAAGAIATLPPGPLDTFGARTAAFFAEHKGPQLLLGALPFERTQHDWLVQPRLALDTARQRVPPAAATPLGRWRVTADPPPHRYAAMVAAALHRMADSAQPPLDKIVLARRLLVEADGPIDAGLLAARLARDPGITTFALPLPPSNGQPRTLVGATPELLLSKSGRALLSNPLAGSARRHADPAADSAAAEALEKSDKNRREHAAVVEAILDALAPHCAELSTPDGTVVQSTASMWHLGTRIEGRLRNDELSAADIVALIHPTPAVCGTPRPRAEALIRKLEPFERGFYAGAVGWVDGHGDGEWHIALRCGEIVGNRITLYAGAGIVPGSDPQAETEETSAKFVALLRALGIDEQGRPVAGDAA